ncbi:MULTISPECIES: hypothetical protein [Sphingobacterium]|uniref:hypothetical protein n=1 Tax=Sphingobacterium TaxID=28453 RepID=UPI00257B5E7C|nr:MULTISPECIES: hypothetical protein [Sphingobacterium]
MMIRQFIFAVFAFIYFLAPQKTQAQETCEKHTAEILPLITGALNNNEFDKITPLLNTLQASCGVTEFGQRLRILLLIIDKKDCGTEIERYIGNQLDKTFVQRLDAADRGDFAQQYEQNKSIYNFFPLRHPLDNLIKIRARALLSSTNYSLNDRERDILHLFADTDSPEDEPAPQNTEQPKSRPQVYGNRSRSKLGYVPLVGVMSPLGGTNKIFGTNFMFGFMLMSSLERKFIFEGGFNVRINSNDKNIAYNYEGSDVTINSSATGFIGGSVGYKIFDNEKCILIPKGIIGIDITDTGITESVYSDGYYDPDGYYYDGGYNDRMVTINNVHLGLGFSSLFQMKNKKYVGIEVAYHYAPYDASSKVLTPIQSNYGTAAFFFRF